RKRRRGNDGGRSACARGSQASSGGTRIYCNDLTYQVKYARTTASENRRCSDGRAEPEAYSVRSCSAGYRSMNPASVSNEDTIWPTGFPLQGCHAGLVEVPTGTSAKRRRDGGSPGR